MQFGLGRYLLKNLAGSGKLLPSGFVFCQLVLKSRKQMEIKAFKAYRFNPDVVGEAGACIAPPYDVISSEQQTRLYQQSPYNIVRIIKGKTEAGDNETKNQYTRAADYLKDWLAKGALKQDDKEAIYAYVQDFEIAGKNTAAADLSPLANWPNMAQAFGLTKTRLMARRRTGLN